MRLILIKGYFPADFPYKISPELQKEIGNYIQNELFPALGLDAYRPDYTLELAFFAKDEESAYTLIKGRVSHKKKDMPFGIRMSVERLSASQREGLAAFLEFFEAGLKDIVKALDFEAEKVSLEPLKSRLLAQPEVHFAPLSPDSPVAQLLARVRELPR
jgi:hypothetical protein